MVELSPPRVGSSVLVSLAALVVIVAGLKAAQAIVVPILVAAFLTLLSLPTLHWFQRKGLPTWLAMVAITFIAVLVGIVIVGVVGSSVMQMQQQLPAYQERVVALQTSLNDWLIRHDVEKGLYFDQQFFNAERLFSLFTNVVGALGGVLNNALIVLFMLIFMQLEAADVPAKLDAIAPQSSKISVRAKRIQSTVWQYMRLKTRISLLTGVLVAAWLWFWGVHFPLLWGLVAFLFNFVPNIGSFIAAFPAVLIAALQPDIAGEPISMTQSLYLAAYAAAGYVIINLVIGNVVEPRMLSSGVGLSTLVVFLSLVFWGWVLGPVGMVLSVPLTMIVRIVLDNSDELRWIAILLGPEVPTVSETKPA